jgi:hypothetical protein
MGSTTLEMSELAAPVDCDVTVAELLAGEDIEMPSA